MAINYFKEKYQESKEKKQLKKTKKARERFEEDVYDMLIYGESPRLTKRLEKSISNGVGTKEELDNSALKVVEIINNHYAREENRQYSFRNNFRKLMLGMNLAIFSTFMTMCYNPNNYNNLQNTDNQHHQVMYYTPKGLEAKTVFDKYELKE